MHKGNVWMTGQLSAGSVVCSNSLTIGATNVAPANTTTPKFWITVTNAGQAYRVPLYQ